jgi:excisionase family DNA binding protein
VLGLAAGAIGPSQRQSGPQSRTNDGASPRRLDRESSVLPRLLTLRQAAAYVQVSYWTVRVWVESGKLPACRLPGDGRLLRIERAELDRLIEQSRVA